MNKMIEKFQINLAAKLVKNLGIQNFSKAFYGENLAEHFQEPLPRFSNGKRGRALEIGFKTIQQMVWASRKGKNFAKNIKFSFVSLLNESANI